MKTLAGTAAVAIKSLNVADFQLVTQPNWSVVLGPMESAFVLQGRRAVLVKPVDVTLLDVDAGSCPGLLRIVGERMSYRAGSTDQKGLTSVAFALCAPFYSDKLSGNSMANRSNRGVQFVSLISL